MLLKPRLLLSGCLLVCLYSGCSSNNNSNSQTGSVSTTTTTQPAGVNQSPANTNAPPATPASQPPEATGAIDACSLLDSKEIARVQGWAIKETKSNQRSDGGFLMSQCFYTAEEFVRSVSLSVVQPNPANSAKQPREYFTERFGKAGEKSGAEREREKEREKEREREKAKEQREKEKGAGQQERGEEEEEEEGGNAERVSGVGEQAYWVKTGPSAALYVLQKNQFLILSIGGGDAEQVKLRKTKELAQQALKRMK